ncbi:hypothetical protein SLH49_05230 [Cognatiyoonia sp. IB215446]|uniref:hypothetical protein n=1 Tax=Cognatiyoonia sp. IB215446 TaxID=3097355 RepID=UPI002A0EB888|nr:hypothetical protein [Cognatiyoonia sp. IB215446]MDX8347384.1 hypothetical protein [Cognatiyoonia sp. IB215446]
MFGNQGNQKELMMSHNKRFQDFIQLSLPAEPILPAVHTTTVTAFSSILDAGKISLTECKFYKEPLLYLFYGKPAYKIQGRQNAATKILGDAAVTFVFNVHSLPKIHKSFALDTGAAFGSRYDQLLPAGLEIDDFGMSGEYTDFARFVTCFFGSNRDYYLGNPSNKNDPSPLDVVSTSMRDIANSVSSDRFDERACSCEIQLQADILLSDTSMVTIIMPDRLFDDEEVRRALTAWKIKPVLYRMKRALPSERTEIIAEKLGDFYESEGYI